MDQKVNQQQNTKSLEQQNYARQENFTPALLESFRRSGGGSILCLAMLGRKSSFNVWLATMTALGTFENTKKNIFNISQSVEILEVSVVLPPIQGYNIQLNNPVWKFKKAYLNLLPLCTVCSHDL